MTFDVLMQCDGSKRRSRRNKKACVQKFLAAMKIEKRRSIKAFHKVLGSMAISIVIIEGVVHMQRAYNK